jgi:hypothetical protein
MVTELAPDASVDSYFSVYPQFEVTTRVRFDGGTWQEFAKEPVPPTYADWPVVSSYQGPTDSIPAIMRAQYQTDELIPAQPEWAGSAPGLMVHIDEVTPPAGAHGLELQYRLHAFFIARYDNDAQVVYLGANCIHSHADGERVELGELWDTRIIRRAPRGA